MKLQEISKPKTVETLNENLSKKFGQTIKVDAFTLEQLQDARNKIRTKLSQFETNESYDSVLKDSNYQKNKLFLDVLNTAIAEREELEEKGAKPDYLDFDKDGDKKEPMKKALKDKKKKGPPVKEGMGSQVFSEIEGINDVYDELEQLNREKMGGGISEQLDIMRQHIEGLYKLIGKDESQMEDTPRPDRESKSDKAQQKELARLKKLKDEYFGNPNHRKKYKNPKSLARPGVYMDEGKAIIENYFKHLLEGEEDKAEIVMAAKDMVDRVTSWMEDTAEMQAESMLELGDAIRDEQGQAQSETYIQTVKPALESLYQSLEATRASLTSGVAKLTGEEEPAVEMGGEEPGMDTGMDAEPGMDAEEPMAEPGDDFGAAEPAAGGEEEAGRTKRESIERSVRLGQILSSKKK